MMKIPYNQNNDTSLHLISIAWRVYSLKQYCSLNLLRIYWQNADISVDKQVSTEWKWTKLSKMNFTFKTTQNLNTHLQSRLFSSLQSIKKEWILTWKVCPETFKISAKILIQIFEVLQGSW